VPTNEKLRAGLLEDIDEAALRRWSPRVPRQPTHCTVGVDHYSAGQRHAGNRRVPVLHMSGLWLEQLGFAICSNVRITVCAGGLVVSVAGRASQTGDAMVLEWRKRQRLPSWHAGRLVDIVFHASQPVTTHQRSC